MTKIMVADDELAIREIVRIVAGKAGYDFCEAGDGLSAVETFRSESPDLVIVDVMMPEIDGFELCSLIRAADPDVPIMFLSAKTSIEDKATGFNRGGDDYLTKPFSPVELHLRIESLLRRASKSSASAVDDSISFGNVVLHPLAYEVTKDGVAIAMTSKEFEILSFLASHPAQVFSREQIASQVWGDDYVGDLSSINVHVRHIREKIEDNPAKPKHLLTVWGVGYKFVK